MIFADSRAQRVGVCRNGDGARRQIPAWASPDQFNTVRTKIAFRAYIGSLDNPVSNVVMFPSMSPITSACTGRLK